MSKSVAVLGSDQVPLAYTVPVPGTLTTLSASAVYDGSTANAFLPAVSMYDSDGNLIARATAPEVAAGGSAEVSWFPGAGLEGAGGGDGLPCCFLDFNTPITLSNWGGFYTAVNWELIFSNDPTTFTWPSGGDNSKIGLLTAGFYRFVYQLRFDTTSFPSAPGTVLSVPSVTVVGGTNEELSLNAANADLYRGDPTTGFPYGPISERVFRITSAQDLRLFVAWTGTGTAKILSGNCFAYRLGGL